MSFKESEHPRDADGKFTDGTSKGKEKSLEEIAREIFPHLTKDKDGDKILSTAPDKESAVVSIYVNSNDNLNRYAHNIPAIPGYEDFVIHGDSDLVQLRDLDGEVVSNYTAKEFAQILSEDPNYNGGNIRLISCSAGNGDECFAQQLADELGVSVLAPSGVVVVYPDGKINIQPSETSKKGKWRIFTPRDKK